MTTVRAEVEIAAPAELVRRHFWDMPYHAANPVHAGVSFEVEQASDERCVYRQRTRILGAELVDTLENTRTEGGGMLARTTAGPNVGTEARFRFDILGPERTRVIVEVTLRPRGIMRALTPVVAWLTRRGFDRALEEDRRDIESGAYR